jgi:hypothetical protein
MPLPGLPGVSDDRLFEALNACLLGWALLALPLAWRPRAWESFVLARVALFGLLYVFLLASALTTGAVPNGAGFDSLDGVARLFSSREAVFAGWVHYVGHDLLAGLWVVKDARASGVPHWLVAPVILPLALLAGPAGVLAYLALRAALPARWRAAKDEPPRCPFAGKAKAT